MTCQNLGGGAIASPASSPGSDSPDTVSDPRAVKWFLSRKEMMLLWYHLKRSLYIYTSTMWKILFHTKLREFKSKAIATDASSDVRWAEEFFKFMRTELLVLSLLARLRRIYLVHRYHLRIFQQLPHQTVAYLNGKYHFLFLKCS